MNNKAFLVDSRAGTNAEEAKDLKWWILDFINKKKIVSADEIYEESYCGDIAMYLALHELTNKELIEGLSPYETNLTSHTEWIYQRRLDERSLFFYNIAENHAKDWNPDIWE